MTVLLGPTIIATSSFPEPGGVRLLSSLLMRLKLMSGPLSDGAAGDMESVFFILLYCGLTRLPLLSRSGTRLRGFMDGEPMQVRSICRSCKI